MLNLSRRKLEVLRARCESRNRAQAGEKLGIAETTVNGHMKLILAYLHVETDAQACYLLAEDLKAMNGDREIG